MRYFKNGISAVAFILLSRLIAIFTEVRENKVFFVSDVRAELGGNLKDVYDYLDGSYEKVTYLKADRRQITGPGKFLRFVYDMTTAGTILLDDYFRYTSYYRVRPGQQICQLWHGAGAFKKFGYSRAAGNEKIRIHKGYRKYAKAIVSAESIRGCYAEAFGLPPEKVRATGVPRTDLFFDAQKIRETQNALYEEFPQLERKKVVLFAPTYRGLRADDAGYDFDRLDLERIREGLGEDYIFVFKWHPAVYNNILRHKGGEWDPGKYGGFYLDLSEHREINDLLLVTDVLITDYSSVIFDYFFVNKPIVFYAYDREVYADGRGLYYPYEDYLYGPVVTGQQELIRAVREGDMAEEKRAAFGQRFLSACDGHSTERTCKWIFGKEAGTDGNCD